MSAMTMAPVKHGTAYRYDRGCRCPDCRTAKYAYRRAARAKARAELRPSYLHELAQTKARKDRYRGTCEICGALTDGSTGRANAPTRCVHHNRGAETMRSRRGQGELQTWIVGLLRVNGPMRAPEIAAASDTTEGSVRITLHRLRQDGRVSRVSRGLYAVTA